MTWLLLTVFVTNPGLLPVTEMERFFPRSARPTTHPDPVAPAIFLSSRYHWTARATGLGAHSPTTAVRVLPGCAVPVIVRRTPVRVPPVTSAVGALTTVDKAKPVFDPVTDTLRRVPASRPTARYVDRVAPEIGTPDRSHW
jgi:hypothetical protein